MMGGVGGSAGGRPRGPVERVVDRVAEWLLPDPTAYVEKKLRELREQDQGKKPPQKG